MFNQIEGSYRPRTRIVAITHTTHPGGAERTLIDYIKNAHSTRVTALGIATEEGILSNEVPRSVPIITGETDANRLADKCIRHGADAVFVWGDYDARHIVLNHGIPVFQFSHSGIPAQRSESRLVNATFLGACNEEARLWYPKDRRKDVVIVHNGAELGRVVPRITPAEQRSRWGIPEDAPICLYLGRLSAGKGIDKLLTQWGSISQRYVNSGAEPPHLVIVGQGDLAERLRQIAESEAVFTDGLPNIHFPKPSTFVGNFLSAANMVLLPSEYEAFPLVWIEAVLAGKPILCAKDLPFLDELAQVDLDLTQGTRHPIKLETVQDAIAGNYTNGARLAQSAALQYLTAGHMTQRLEAWFHNSLQHWYAAGIFSEVERPRPPETEPDDS